MAAQLPPADPGLIPPEVRSCIPGCESGMPPQAVYALPGGGRNLVLRVDTRLGRFVWRSRAAPIDRPGSAAVTELHAQQAAAAAGLAPRVVAADARGQWLLMEFLELPVWSVADLQDAARLDALAEQLVRLHALPVPEELPVVDAAGIARGYLQQLAAQGAAAARPLSQCADLVESLASEIAAHGAPPVLVHGDLVVANMLGPAPVLVDWEYAQRADATWDLACLTAYYPQLQLQLPRLLAHLNLQGAAQQRLELQRRLFSVLNALWARLHGHNGG
ncbi:MAG: phosphotransferase [Steroidobacteraceae bacterium]